MPRIYKRKGNRRSYTDEQLREVLDLIRTHQLPIKRCALRYGIPRETLRDHLKGRRGTKGSSKGGCGRGTALPLETEKELAASIRTMSANGFGLTKVEVLNLVQDYLKSTGTQTRFKNNRPGQEWWLAFKKRHNLSIKKPEALEHSRKSQGCDPFIMYEFYDRLEQAITHLGLENKPTQIYNCDETSFCHDPSKTKVVAAVGKSCHRYTAGSGRENTSVLACVNAAGEKMPPLVIYKGKNMWDKWIPKEGDYPNTAYTSTPKGWMTAEVFSNWFRYSFLPFIGASRPVMLIFDGHVSHITPQIMTLAKENNVDIQKLPAHTSHLLQPLDVACFRALKVKWDQNLATWQRKNVGERPSKQKFAKLLGETWNGLTAVNIQSGFKRTGIFDPDCHNATKVNRNAINRSTFDPFKLDRYNHLNNPVQCIIDTDNNATDTDNHAHCTSEDISSISSRKQMPLKPINSNTTDGLNTFERLLLQSVKSTKAEQIKTPKKKVAGTAEILTLSSLKEKSSIKSQNPKKGTKIIDDSSSSENEEYEKESSDSFMDLSDEEFAKLSDEEDSTSNVKINDFYLVKFNTKTRTRYFVGKVIVNYDDKWEITFLRCKDKRKGIFKWPAVEDKFLVMEKDLIKKIALVSEDRRGLHHFNVDFSTYNIS